MDEVTERGWVRFIDQIYTEATVSIVVYTYTGTSIYGQHLATYVGS